MLWIWKIFHKKKGIVSELSMYYPFLSEWTSWASEACCLYHAKYLIFSTVCFLY